ncbi:MAG: flagellar biosynthetic protein FliO [Ideonella sp.]|nr:flagellar biosynthetic protein FliO [Ideonella sp.]
MTPAISSLLWFVAILAAIPVVLWMVKRSPLGRLHGLGPQGPGAMRTVSTLALSPSQRLVTVEVGEGEQRRWLVLGVTPSSIQTVHVLDPQAAPVAADVSAPASAASAAARGASVLPFSHWLDRMRAPTRPSAGRDAPGQGHA